MAGVVTGGAEDANPNGSTVEIHGLDRTKSVSDACIFEDPDLVLT